MTRSLKYSIGIGTLSLAALAAPLTSLNIYQANAACAYSWEMKDGAGKDESVNMCSGENQAKTFTSRISDDGIVTVNLNNYKGEAFTLHNYGTGMYFQKVIVNLSGENEITAVDGIALDTFAPMEFTGSGSLKIKALIPMMNGGVYTTKDYQIVTVPEILKQYMASSQQDTYTSEITIRPNLTTNKPTTPDTDNDDKTEEKPDDTEKPADDEKSEDCIAGTDKDQEENPWNWAMIAIHLAAGIYIVLSLVTFILLGIRKISRKHQPKNAKKIIIEEKETEIVEPGTQKTKKDQK